MPRLKEKHALDKSKAWRSHLYNAHRIAQTPSHAQEQDRGQSMWYGHGSTFSKVRSWCSWLHVDAFDVSWMQPQPIVITNIHQHIIFSSFVVLFSLICRCFTGVKLDWWRLCSRLLYMILVNTRKTAKDWRLFFASNRYVVWHYQFLLSWSQFGENRKETSVCGWTIYMTSSTGPIIWTSSVWVWLCLRRKTSKHRCPDLGFGQHLYTLQGCPCAA